jgi:hypothetical protein
VKEYSRNHLAARCYLDAFTDASGCLKVWGRYRSGPRLDRPKNVGYRKDFWGEDGELRAVMERKLAAVEAETAPILRQIPGGELPDVGSVARGKLVEFIAIHMVRTPAYRKLLFDVRSRLLREQGHDRPGHEHVASYVLSDQFWLDATLRQIPTAGSVIASMYWDLVEFPEPWLLTTDQPVVQFPFLMKEQLAMATDPTPGLLNTLEFRFVVGPRHAIVMSWLDAPEEPGVWCGDLRAAADLNRSAGARTDLEFFFHPSLREVKSGEVV